MHCEGQVYMRWEKHVSLYVETSIGRLQKSKVSVVLVTSPVEVVLQGTRSQVEVAGYSDWVGGEPSCMFKDVVHPRKLG